MIPPAFDYAAPNSVNEAIALLGQHQDAKILAGGHSLIPMMRFRLATPALLIDINRIDGLNYIRQEGGWLKIGAMTREVDLDRSELVRSRYPLLHDTTGLVADPLVRNLATVGGNLAHADPANDHPATMLAYGAEVAAAGPNGERAIPIGSFFTGPFETSLARDEILTEIRIPAPQPRSGGAYAKMERKVGDFATAAVAAQVRLGNGGQIESAGIGLTNVGLTPIRAEAAEQALLGAAPDSAAIRAAAARAAEAADPAGDYRGSVEYKRALVRTLTARALRKAIERAQGGQA
jgi:carbon-monoxide dehydrogenase medium subunit